MGCSNSIDHIQLETKKYKVFNIFGHELLNGVFQMPEAFLSWIISSKLKDACKLKLIHIQANQNTKYIVIYGW